MEATNTQVRTGTIPPVVAARYALWTFVIVNLVIVEALFFTAGTGKNGVLTVAKFFGMHAALLLLCQLLLVARLPWLDRRIGMDRLTVWHRWVGFTLMWTLLTHAFLVVLGYATLDDASMTKTFFALAGVPASLFGMLAAAIVVVVAAVSARQVRRRLRYETWHGVHLLLYVALGLAFVHQLQEPTTFKTSAFATTYWWALWLFAFGALVTGRIVMPLWRNAYHRFEVAEVVRESDNVVSVRVTGRNLDKLLGPGWPVLHLAVPRAQPLVAGQSVLAVGGTRRPQLAPDRQGGRQRQRRPAERPGREPRIRRRAVRSVHRAAPNAARRTPDRRRSGHHAGPSPAGGGTGR